METETKSKHAGEFWQYLLAAELPNRRAAALVREFRKAYENEPSAAPWMRSLTEAESARVAETRIDRFHRAMDHGARIVEPHEYPTRLRDIGDAPPAVFAWGDFASLQSRTIAIVGTRNASTYGKAVAQKFAEKLALAGLTIVSGGALGVDAAAHEGALVAKGKTVAVLAGGVDYIYPAQHGGLFQRIRGSGCLVSQFAAGSKPSRYRFVGRNHLIAGLSEAVLVVEAPASSGALITSHAAMEMGRQVFVVPANVDQVRFKGSHALIRDGATLVDCPEHVLQDLRVETPISAEPPVTNLTKTQQRIMACLNTTALAPELICAQLQMDSSEVLAELTMLEVDGHVIRDGGGFAKRP